MPEKVAEGLGPFLLSRVRWRPWCKNALSPDFSGVSARRDGVGRQTHMDERWFAALNCFDYELLRCCLIARARPGEENDEALLSAQSHCIWPVCRPARISLLQRSTRRHDLRNEHR